MCWFSDCYVTHVGILLWSFHRNVNPEKLQLEIVYDSLLCSLAILLLAAIWTKFIGPYGGLEVDKQAIERESRYYMEWPIWLMPAVNTSYK